MLMNLPQESWLQPILVIWWVVAAMLVVLMQVGFIYLEMGSINRPHRPGIALKNFVLFLCSSFAFSIVGMQIMYGADVDPWGLFGWGEFKEPFASYGPTWTFYQIGFAAVAATIISGALAGRTTLLSNAIIGTLIAGLVYPIYGHWMWGGGVLDMPHQVHDFAGSAVVHFLGGGAALVGASIVGSRTGWLAHGKPTGDLGPRSIPLATIGVIFLWIGWIGFNGGSVAPDKLGDDWSPVGDAILFTCAAASVGGMAAICLAGFVRLVACHRRQIYFREAFQQRQLFDPFATLSGTMGGMVAVTANCDWISMQGAVWIGVLGGVGTFIAANVIRELVRVDDPVEAVAVHAGAGAVGMLAVAAGPEATLYGQILALVSAGVLIAVLVVPAFLVLRRLNLLRCSEEEEIYGLTYEPAIIPQSRPSDPEPRGLSEEAATGGLQR